MKKRLFLLLIFVFIPIAVFSQSETQKPLVLKLVEKPAQLRIGKSYKFVFDVINISQKPVTLSSICNASASLTWENRDGTGGGYGSGCVSSTIVVSHYYDPQTKTITSSGSRIVPYTENSFFTLESNSNKRFETTLVVQKGIKPKWVTVHIKFESKYDGSLVGLTAWTGVISYDLKMFARK